MSVHNKRQVLIDNEVLTSVMPSQRAELFNEVILKNGFHIRGGIYANTLSGSGGGIVQGPVLVKKEIVLEPPISGEAHMIFACGLNASDAIQINFPVAPKSSPVVHHIYNPLIIRGDICTSSLKIENALMLGNIHCDNAIIKDSIIFGTPIVKGSVQLHNSTVISIRAEKVRFYGKNTLVVPFATAKSDFEFHHGKAKAPHGLGEAVADHDARVRYMGICNSEHTTRCSCEEVFTCNHYLAGKCEYSELLLQQDDVINLRRQDQLQKVLTLVQRMTDTRPVQDNVNALTDFMHILNALPHMNDKSRNAIEREISDSGNMEWSHFTKVFSYCTPRHGDEKRSFSAEEKPIAWSKAYTPPAAATAPQAGAIDTGDSRRELETGSRSDACEKTGDSGAGRNAAQFDDGLRSVENGARSAAAAENYEKKNVENEREGDSVREDAVEAVRSRPEPDVAQDTENSSGGSNAWEVVQLLKRCDLMPTALLRKNGEGTQVVARKLPAVSDTSRYAALTAIIESLGPRHPSVLAYSGLETVNGETFLVRAYEPGNAIGQIISGKNAFKWPQLYKILLAVANSIVNFDQPHGMLHVNNVFINAAGKLVFGDYGMPTIARAVSQIIGKPVPLRHIAYEGQDPEAMTWRYDAYCMALMAIEMIEGELDDPRASIGKGFPRYRDRTGETVDQRVVQTIVRMLNDKYESKSEMIQHLRDLGT